MSARGDKRAQIGALGLIDRRRNGDDVEIGLSQALRIGGVGDALGLRELLLGYLARAIDPAAELGDALAIDVEADHGEMPRKIDGERQPDIAKTDNADSHVGEDRQAHRSFPLKRKDDGSVFLQCAGQGGEACGSKGAPAALLASGDGEVQEPGQAPRLSRFSTRLGARESGIGLFDGDDERDLNMADSERFKLRAAMVSAWPRRLAACRKPVEGVGVPSSIA